MRRFFGRKCVTFVVRYHGSARIAMPLHPITPLRSLNSRQRISARDRASHLMHRVRERRVCTYAIVNRTVNHIVNRVYFDLPYKLRAPPKATVSGQGGAELNVPSIKSRGSGRTRVVFCPRSIGEVKKNRNLINIPCWRESRLTGLV